LEGTDKQWLSDLLHAFSKGDIDKFNAVIASNAAEFDAQPALATKRESIKEKIALLALMVLVFQRPSHERNISFAEIADVTRLPVDQVEWLVMRALSLGLIKGSIDQVDAIVRVSWVQVNPVFPLLWTAWTGISRYSFAIAARPGQLAAG
jgi:26S proteasome regulatory subunit N9